MTAPKNTDKAAAKTAEAKTAEAAKVKEGETATANPPADGNEGDTKPAKAGKGGKAAAKGEANQVSLPAGKGTQNTKSPGGPAPIPRSDSKGDEDPGATEGKEDTIRRQADKARWTYGQNTDDTATMLAEQREIDKAERERGR